MVKSPITVIYTEPFNDQYDYLANKYRSIDDDIKPVVEALKQGETPGDRIPGVGSAVAYKCRAKNKAAGKGKSGGYRVIYYLRTEACVYMLFVYVKADRENLPANVIKAGIRKVDEDRKGKQGC